MFVPISKERVNGEICVSTKNYESEIVIPEQVVFGKVIEGLRSHEGHSQTSLAKAAGISNAALSRLERGESNPSLGTILALSRGLDLEPHRLMEAYDLAMSGAVERLETAKSTLATGGATAWRPAAALAAAVVPGPAGALLGMAVASAIGAGVFGALASFVSSQEDTEDVSKSPGHRG